MKRYLWLFIAAVALGVVASVASLAPRSGVRDVAAPAADTLALTVELGPDTLMASRTSIAAGTPVALRITNASATARRVRLSGYEDRVDSGVLAPGGNAVVRFVADRPGERFAWLVGDRTYGRLDVTGSHLVEGHR